MKRGINLPHVARVLLWCYAHVTGDAAWAIVGMYGVALSHYAKGREVKGRLEYERARRCLKKAIRNGTFIGLGNRGVQP